MKTILSVLFAASLYLTPFSSVASTASSEDAARKTTVEPCSWWQYDFDAHGYVCRTKGPRVEIYSASDVDRLVQSLQSRIAELEVRVKALEGR